MHQSGLITRAVLPVTMALGLWALDTVRAQSGAPTWQVFLAAASEDRAESEAALGTLAAQWRDGYAALLIDAARFLPSPRVRALAPDDGEDLLAPTGGGPDGVAVGRRPAATPGPLTPAAVTRGRLTTFLEKQTGQRLGDDLRAWRRWLWSRPPDVPADYATYKAALYGRIDPRFRLFFPDGVRASIRLDEIDWGGVGVNGIPPLRGPGHVRASDATWLKDQHVVFGIEVNGEARAYPKRILAWHELALDRLGGVDLTIVYCTLCGTVIPFDSRIGDETYVFGTSGLLYRSNKLMFDEGTGSLWSALDGTPVVGPLVGTGLRLSARGVVTTTWAEWKREYPDTTVLSLDTGHRRDYAEGAAYREYFGHDRLMFEVPSRDGRLPNKAEVVVLRGEVLGGGAAPVAIAVKRLRRERVLSFEAAGRAFVAVTSRGGATRVYERGDLRVVGSTSDAALRDSDGGRWLVTPGALVGEGGRRLPVVPTHQAFWFGWYAQHPETVLLTPAATTEARPGVR
jgi:hypothetical protein